MSVKVMSQVFEKETGSPRRHTVLVAVADHADDEGKGIFPSYGRVAWKTELSHTSVKRTFREFREERVLVKVREATATRPAEYKLDLKALPDKEPFRNARGVRETPQGGHSDPSRGSE